MSHLSRICAPFLLESEVPKGVRGPSIRPALSGGMDWWLIFQSPENVFKRPTFSGKSWKFRTVTEVLWEALMTSCQKDVRNPNHHYFSKMYRNTTPIRLQFVSQYFRCPYALRKGKHCQYSSHLYRSAPPICIAIRLPSVSQYFWENLGGCGHRDVPHPGVGNQPAPYRGLPGPLGPKCRKSLENVSRGLWPRHPKKSPRKSRNTPRTLSRHFPETLRRLAGLSPILS